MADVKVDPEVVAVASVVANSEMVEAFGEELAETMISLGVCLEGITDAVQFAERHVTNKRVMKGDLIAAGDVLYAYIQRLVKLSDALSEAREELDSVVGAKAA